MDKKSLIGLGLIALILGVWLYLSGPTKEQIANSKRIKDSIALVEKEQAAKEAALIAAEQAKYDTLKSAAIPDSVKATVIESKYKDFAISVNGNEETFLIENENVKVHISNKGGVIEKVELKNYHRPGSEENLILFDKDTTRRFALQLHAYNADNFSTDEFYFKAVKQSTGEITLRLETSKPNSYIEYSYSLKPNDYMVNSNIRFVGMENILNQNEEEVELNWGMLYPSQEQHVVKEREVATVYFKQDINSPDYINPTADEEKEINEADVKWVSFKQQFFNSTIIAENVFPKTGSRVTLTQLPNSEDFVKKASARLSIPYNHTANENFAFKFYFGPNHYNTLKQYDYDLEKIIPTGWSIFSYINKWLVIPLFNAWDNANMGLVILLLTVILKIILLPIAYKTYMSGAKMRVLKPETDALNEKFGKNADPMKKQQEQMALYRKAGVNPLSGCLPLLLQFPILIALFNFVPAAIELRQKSFLWADDLSTYDSIWTFGNVPFISWAYGDHVSLFALLMFVSTLLYTYMNSNMMPQNNQQMPGMKFMMYFMPVIFLAVMNRYAAGLSWYYFLANVFNFAQNYVIKLIVSDKKIRAQLEANMKKPVKVSNFQKRLAEMAKQQQQLKGQQAASKGKKK